MQRLPSLAGLIAFDAVARHLNFSKAGRDLHITQGAVSHRIRALEEELGVTLLIRTSRRVQLTLSGQILLRATGEAFGRLRAGLVEMESVGNPRRVTVSCSPSFAIRWLVPHLGALRSHHPDVELHISAEDDLVEPGFGGIDACIRFGAGGYRGVDAEQLTLERVTPVCSPFYAERVGLKTPSDLSGCLLLHDDVLLEHDAHVGWREWAEHAGLTELEADRGLRFSHAHMALDAAVAGQGIALARRSLVRRDFELKRLIAPFEVELASGLTYWLIKPKNAVLSRSTMAFCEWLRLTLESDLDAGPLCQG